MPAKAGDGFGLELNADIATGDFVVLGPTNHSESFDIGDVPLLLLPVRIETRFAGEDRLTPAGGRRAGRVIEGGGGDIETGPIDLPVPGPPTLKIRIYPDQIHVEDHAPLLTKREYDLGVAYWNRRLDGDPDGARDALVAQLRPRRAVWVARETRPGVSPKTPTPSKTPKARAAPGDFPDLELRTKARAATAALMPVRWCAIGFIGATRAFTAWSSEVSEPLACSPDVADLTPYADDDESLPVDEQMAWMVDYEKALAAGMAISVDVSDLDFGDNGLTLVVVGIRDTVNAEAALLSVLEAHHYTDGVEVLRQGTPTNNTDEGIAGWTADVDDVAALFARELDDEGLAPATDSAAVQLADALGFADDDLLRRLPGADIDEDAAMAAMNRALWPVTWGRYLDDLLAPESGTSVVPAAKRNALRDFFIDYVRGGAPLPTLAIGSQPYGILPLMRRDGGDLQSSDPLTALEAVLLDQREHWRASLPAVARLDPVDGGADDELAAEVLGSLPHPGRFVVRRLTWQRELRTGVWAWLWDLMSGPDHPLVWLAYCRFMSFDMLESVEEEIEFLEDLKEEPTKYGVDADDVDDAEVVLGAFISMCRGHQARQTPINEWYGDKVNGVFDDWVTSDPKIFFSDYGTATADRLFNYARVAAGGGGPAAYLSALHERVSAPVASPAGTAVDKPHTQGIATRSATTRSISSARRTAAAARTNGGGSGPPAQPRATKKGGRELPSRAGASAQPRVPKEGGRELPGGGPLGDGPIFDDGPVGGGQTGPAPADFSDGEPLLYQLLDAVVDDVPSAEGVPYRAALTTLAERPTDELELRLRETLGLASHRLDAWLTALASHELADRRAAGRGGIRIGAFGWVERLFQDSASTRESQGFVHAPSLAHAATAAVLRAGWNAHGTHDPASLMAVDLRSERVRTAAYLLDGIRQGVELGDLLGCRFERRLHDAFLDHFIDPCRRRVLEADGITRAPRGPVDGLDLAALYNDTGIKIEPASGSPYTIKPEKRETVAERAGLQDALDDILASMDAVADAAIADSVHHLLQANTSRASATLDAVATGAVPPPELRGLETPRPGASVSHRVLVTLGVTADTKSEWSHTSPRAVLEPGLERWVAGLLGSPDAVHFGATVAGAPVDVTFAQLVKGQDVSALDAVFEGEAGWAARVRAHLEADDVVVDLAPTGLTGDALSAADFAELTSALRSLLGRARALDARDLALPGAEIESGADVANAEQRLATFRSGLTKATDTLTKLLPRPTEADPRPVGDARLDELQTALTELARHGVARAIPVHGYVEEGRAALYADAWSAHGVARTRLDAATALDAAWAADQTEPTTDVRARRLRALAAAVLGKGFPVLPRFSADADDFDAALDKSDVLLGGESARATDWLRSVSRARVDVARLADVVTATELLRDAVAVQPLVGQLPLVAGEPWVALSGAADRRRGKVSLFVVDDGGRALLKGGKPAGGLVVDSWAEVVPVEEVVTGVALNYDAPTSRPPQAWLLALPPAGREWSFDNVVDTLLEGFEAAKLRAVDPDVLGTYGHQMPAIFPPGYISAGPQEELVG